MFQVLWARYVFLFWEMSQDFPNHLLLGDEGEQFDLGSYPEL